MANRRMFSLGVIDSDKFIEMPASSQNLYFHLGMRADDDGFVASPKKILKFLGCGNDDLNILISRGYVIPFESGVIVIVDWKENNQLRSDRYHPTKFQTEMSQLAEINGSYALATKRETIGIPNGNQLADNLEPEVSIGKYRLGEGSVESISTKPEEAIEVSEEKSGITLPLLDGTDYNVSTEKISVWEKAYPAVDVRQELYKMIAWLNSNTEKRKTRRGIDRFINNWLERSQNKGCFNYSSKEKETGRNGANTTQYQFPSFGS
ncbi:MAG: hypothetical protein LUE87_09350 [Lachnospiraceae bacterium]|nr:hypothetical protein [Lachnospiraceae bacterium]